MRTRANGQALHRRNESASTAVSVGSPMSHWNHDRKSSIASQHSLTSSSSGPSPTIRSFPAVPPSFQPILVPIVQSLSLLEASISSRRRTHFQPSTACVISAIRSALAEADCLSKESDTLTRWPVLAKERKLVLVELSRLVTCARDASGTGTAEGEETSQVGSVEELGKAARNVFASVQKFFTMAAEMGVQPKPQRAGPEKKPEQAEASPKPPLPPAAALRKRSPTVQSATSISSGSTASTRPSRVRSPPPSNPRMQEAFRKATSVGDLRAARRRASSPPPPLPTAPALVSRGNTQSPSPSSTPMSSAFGSSSSSGKSSPAVTKSTHVRRVQGSMDSTVSHASSDAFGLDDTVDSSSEPGHPRPSGKRLSTLEEVLKAIQLAEERLFSIIAALVGHVHAHHHHAHPSSHALLIETTRETVDSIRELLTVVEAVGRHDGVRAARPAEVDRLRVIKDELYDVASQLVESAEVVANAPFDLPEAEEKDYAGHKSQLLNATTSTLRKSSECLRAVRLCVPQDEAELEGTPRPDDHVDPRQATPRPADHGASLRVNAVGARGLHTLSGLHRKATSLSQLQRRYQQEVGFVQSTEEDTEEEDDDDEEVVSDMGRDEDVTLRPTAPFPVYGVSVLCS
jgi:son of sevenless-like protein